MIDADIKKDNKVKAFLQKADDLKMAFAVKKKEEDVKANFRMELKQRMAQRQNKVY